MYSRVCKSCGGKFETHIFNITTCDTCRTVECKYCSKKFVQKNSGNVFCSPECRENFHSTEKKKMIKHCLNCNKEFTTNKPNAKYCCTQCGFECRQGVKPKITKKCDSCGEEFYTTRSGVVFCESCRYKPRFECICVVCRCKFKSKSPIASYCSDSCRNKLITKKCIRCNKKFQVKFYQQSTKKYCSVECRHGVKNVHSNQTTKVNPVEPIVTHLIEQIKQTGKSFNGVAIDYYNMNFNQGVKDFVLKRDNYSCQICKKDTDLEVHHKIKRKNGGEHSPDNLITLCASCHRAIETGDLHHALRKCERNYRKNCYREIEKLENEMDRLERVAKIKSDLIYLFSLVSRDEKEDALVLLDELIDRIS